MSWATTIFQNFLIAPLEAKTLEKIPLLHKSKFFPSSLIVFYRANRKSSHKTSPCFLPASPVGEQTAEEKVGRLTVPPRQPLVKLFSPGSRPHSTKIGSGHTGNGSKKLAKHRALNSSAIRGNR
jgi:hypothetical protein